MPKWNPKEIEYLRENYQKLGGLEIAKNLNRTLDSVQTKWLYIQKPPKIKPGSWTKQEIELLQSRYDELGAKEVGRILNRSPRAVIHKASRMGIRAGTGYRNRMALGLRVPSDTPEANCIKTWKRLVKERDNFTCQACNLHEPLIVTAHHIIAVGDGGPKFAVANGITLCPNCHALEHTVKGRDSSGHRIDNATYARIKELLQMGLGIHEVASHVHVNGKTVQAIKDKSK